MKWDSAYAGFRFLRCSVQIPFRRPECIRTWFTMRQSQCCNICMSCTDCPHSALFHPFASSSVIAKVTATNCVIALLDYHCGV